MLLFSSESQREFFYTTDLFIDRSRFVYIKLILVFVLAFFKIAESFVIAYIQAASGDDVFNVKCTEEAYF